MGVKVYIPSCLISSRTVISCVRDVIAVVEKLAVSTVCSEIVGCNPSRGVQKAVGQSPLPASS